MKLRHRYRIHPTAQQVTALAQLFGCCRVVFNDALAFCHENYRKGDRFVGYNQWSKSLTESKKVEEREWLKEVSSIPLQQSLQDLKTAFKNFFDSCQGKRSRNILKVAGGQSETQNGCWRERETADLVAVSSEASTHQKSKQLSLF